MFTLVPIPGNGRGVTKASASPAVVQLVPEYTSHSSDAGSYPPKTEIPPENTLYHKFNRENPA